jgi:hypothetical protein
MTALYLWSTNNKMTLDQIQLETGIGEVGMRAWNSEARDIAERWVNDHQAVIPMGGAGKVVEIDESVFFRRKVLQLRCIYGSI